MVWQRFCCCLDPYTFEALNRAQQVLNGKLRPFKRLFQLSYHYAHYITLDILRLRRVGLKIEKLYSFTCHGGGNGTRKT
jgi:hypothetical protein